MDPPKISGYLTRETLMPLGVVASVMLTVVGGALWLQSRLSAIVYAQETIAVKLDQIQRTIDQQVTHSEMRAWLALIRASNPGLMVPDMPR